MDTTITTMFEGREKKIGCLSKKQARLVIEWLSENRNEDGWEESQVFSHIEDDWGYGGLIKGKITFFCRCFKDSQGRNVFIVEGRRPRKIHYLLPSER